MFATLDGQMRFDDAVATAPKRRMVKWAVIGITAIVLFGTLVFGIQLLA